jgi:hypothetical protein
MVGVRMEAWRWNRVEGKMEMEAWEQEHGNKSMGMEA